MILTEQNNRAGQFGETQRFTVTGHSADTMKKHINSANEQNLAQKHAAVQNRSQAMHPQNGSQNPAAAVRREVHPASGQTRTEQGRVSQIRPDAGQQAPHRNVYDVSARQPISSQRPPVQGSRPTVHAQTAPERSTGSPGTNSRQQTADMRSVQPVQKTLPVQNREARPVQQVQTPAQNTPKPVQVSQKPLPDVRNSTAAAIRDPKSVQMMRTRQTDLAMLYADDRDDKKEKKKKEKEERVSSDEGGNTVLSVVKAVVYIIFILIISVFLALCIINIGNDMFSFVKSDEIVEVVIPEFATLDEVADILYMNDIIKYPTIFKLYAVSKNSDNDFLAGTYPVNAMMNYETLLDEFKEKPETGTVDITIPEGYTIDEIIDLFVNGYNIGTREGFVDVIQNGEFDYWFIKELEENGVDDGRLYRLEGYLFPDTYQFYKASSEYTVVNKMLKRFAQIFTKEYRAQCEVFGYTVDEIVTLASLIEKEAESPAVFFTVSSVFHNRLNTPWQFTKFESDATIAYILSHEKGERTTVSAADLLIDTPYNTYMYNGFPPGPIANPSASALLAALAPEKTEYFYFVAHKGTTKFSATKTEHEEYIAQIREDTGVQQTTGDIPTE